jgi:hypothetical protein
MYKAFEYYTPFSSLFDSYPSLRSMPPKAVSVPVSVPTSDASSPPKLSAAQVASLLAIGKILKATRYEVRSEQREFLDEQTTALVSLPSPLFLHIDLYYF